ncbi:MAG: hypothetical protein EOO62_27020, partial [Hymenobacter sp.]
MPPSTTSNTRRPTTFSRSGSARAEAPVLYSQRAYLLITLGISAAFAVLVLPTSILARPHTSVGQALLLFINSALLFELLFGVNYLLRYRPSKGQRLLSLQTVWADRWLRILLTILVLGLYVWGRHHLDKALHIRLNDTSLLVELLTVVLATAVGFSFQIGIELTESGRHLTQEIEVLKREQLQARY